MEIKDKITEMEREPFASAKIELEHIEIIDSEKASIIIETYKPIGLFMLQDGEKWVGIDNNSGSWLGLRNLLGLRNARRGLEVKMMMKNK
jgi:hypothetical protein